MSGVDVKIGRRAQLQDSIANKDVEAIGAHCHYEYCHQLDFLPFRCDSCKHSFCLEHRTETQHECSKAGGESARKRNATSARSDQGIQDPSSNIVTSSISPGGPSPAAATKCSDATCKTYINTLTSVGVECQICQRQYCLKHRLREDHDCREKVISKSSIPPIASQAEKARLALGRLRIWSKEKQTAGPERKASTIASRTIALNRLKQTAKGDSKIPIEKRIYLHVEAEAYTLSSRLPKGDFYFHKDWSIGRLLDAAAQGLQIQNLNNRVESEEDRLRVFHVEAGRMLEFSERAADSCVSGNTIVLLRGVGAGA